MDEGPGGDAEDDKERNPIKMPEITIEGKKLGFLGNLWNGVKNVINSTGRFVNNFAEDVASSCVLVATSVAMPLINQVHVIDKEGFHDGAAYNPNDNVSWAVPQKIENWHLVPQAQMMDGSDLSWEDGKELIKADFSILMLTTPIKFDVPLPQSTPIIVPEIINHFSEETTKYLIERGVDGTLDYNSEN